MKEIEARRSTALALVSWSLTGLLAGAAVFLVCQAVLRRDCNHWGFDIRQLWAACGLAGAWAGAALCMRRRPAWPQFVLLATAAASALLVFVCDRYNVLVEYGLWCDRGMPLPWSR